jgi:hypothetical protein
MKRLPKLIFVIAGILLTLNIVTARQAAHYYASSVSASAGVVVPAEALYKTAMLEMSRRRWIGRHFARPNFQRPGFYRRRVVGQTFQQRICRRHHAR